MMRFVFPKFFLITNLSEALHMFSKVPHYLIEIESK
jgi:hypothetical protein